MGQFTKGERHSHERGGGLSTLWFTSDTHFDHAAVLRHSDRPWDDVGEMNAAIIDNWNANVGPKDTVWHLGDVHFMSDSDATSWLERLCGHIWVLRGNHDSERELDEAVAVGAIEGWAHVKYLRHNNKKFWLSHYPHRSWQGSNRSENPTFHLFGHSHGDLTVPRGRLMDVGVDAVARWLSTRRDPEANRTMIPFDGVRPEDYRPIGFDEVLGWLEGEPPTNQHGQGSGSP